MHGEYYSFVHQSPFQNILTDLESKGHVVELVDAFGSVVNGIAVENGRVYANADFRKAGGVDGY